ncbi:carbonate dehydratase, eukaryotic-type [Onchocerca flexuosa]|uniref:Carbonate dehydratase, eukaryotic-type n=1 Tax=Onchocerca flexuosa TaxID=387005 RepID=A0A238C236_9BILA|nr:carbonate dehydratase, eukaryotic-type [Onchocerca flexuosa]
MTHIILFLATFYPQLSALRMNDYPWTYDNDLFGDILKLNFKIGPDFWGLLSKKWKMCSKGKMQSPINIKPASILFDPRLSDIKMDQVSTTAEMMNIGQMPRLRVLYDTHSSVINITGGPLNPYKYRLQRIDFHYSNDEMTGSEHAINSRNFPMEIQLIAYNTDLYTNFTTALTLPRGIAAVSIIVLIDEHTNEELLKITESIEKVPFRKRRITLHELKVWKLFPTLIDYVTYEGSMTSPGCYETVTWIILNHPIHITRTNVNFFYGDGLEEQKSRRVQNVRILVELIASIT